MTAEHDVKTGFDVNILRGTKGEVEQFENARVEIIEENPERSEEARGMRSLVLGDRRVRVDKSGKLLRVSYLDVREEEHDEADLIHGNLKKVARRWNRHEDIPRARLAALTIKKSYEQGGDEYEQLRNISRLQRFAIDAYQHGDIQNIEDAEALAELGAEILTSSGYDTVVKPSKLEIKSVMLDALATVDSRNLFNPQSRRAIWDSAIKKTTPHFLFQDDAHEKYSNLFDKLTRVEYLWRVNLREVQELIGEFLKTNASSREYRDRAGNLRNFAGKTMPEIAAAPYKRAATIATLVLDEPHTGSERDDLKEMGVVESEFFPIGGETPFEFLDKSRRAIILERVHAEIGSAILEGQQRFDGTWVEPEEVEPKPDEDPFARFERGKRIDN